MLSRFLSWLRTAIRQAVLDGFRDGILALQSEGPEADASLTRLEVRLLPVQSLPTAYLNGRSGEAATESGENGAKKTRRS